MIRALCLGLLAAALTSVLFPIVSVLVMAVSQNPGLAAISEGPGGLTLSHLSRFVTQSGFWTWLRNSLVVSGGATVTGLTLSATAAYALSRASFPGDKWLQKSLLLTQMFPATMLIVPLYLLVTGIGLGNSTAGLILVYACGSLPFCVWMLKGYFDALPRELDEAAAVDGATPWVIFSRVILPLSRPGLVATGLFSFLSSWNEFILAASFLSDEDKLTLPVALYRYVGGFGADWGAFAAGSLVVSVPVCVLFLWAQRHLVGGLLAGSVK